MARGDHPRRTPLYGGALIVAAMLMATAATEWSTSVGLRIPAYTVAAIAAGIGIVMTLRDLS